MSRHTGPRSARHEGPTKYVNGVSMQDHLAALFAFLADVLRTGGAEVVEDPGYRPPSIADGTVAIGLVDALKALGDEYGPAGVAATAAELTEPGEPNE